MIIIFGCSSIEGKARGAYIHAVTVMNSSLDNDFVSTGAVHSLESITRNLILFTAKCAIYVVVLLLSHEI